MENGVLTEEGADFLGVDLNDFNNDFGEGSD
jgi:hypothetical protein